MNKMITPIFIMGAPRSGTTLLASSISSHPKILAQTEMHFVYVLMQRDSESGPLSSNAILEVLLNDFHFCAINLFENKAELTNFIQTRDIRTIILDIVKLYNIKTHNKDYDYWLEHSPHSHYHLNLILKYFPNAIFIHSVRDPRAVYYSTIKEPWGYKDIITGANQWAKDVGNIYAKSKEYGIYTIKYEEFVENPVACLSDVSDHIGVSYDKNMLNNNGIIRNLNFEKNNPFHGIKIDNKRINKWQNELTKKEVMHINAINHQLMNTYGYLRPNDKLKEITGQEKDSLKTQGGQKHKATREKFRSEMLAQFRTFN